MPLIFCFFLIAWALGAAYFIHESIIDIKKKDK
jgi:hypothetical protein